MKNREIIQKLHWLLGGPHEPTEYRLMIKAIMAKRESINIEMALCTEVWNKIQKAGTYLSK